MGKTAYNIRMSRLKSLLSAPEFEDLAKTLGARLLHPFLLVCISFLILALPLVYLLSPADARRYALPIIFSLGVCIGLLWLEYRGQVRLASVLLIGIFWVVIFYLAWVGSGVRDPAYLCGFLGLILVSGLLLKGPSGIWIALASMAAGLFLLIAEGSPSWSARQPMSSPVVWVAATFIFWIVVVVQRFSIRLHEDTLDRLQAELLERQQIENALRQNEERYRLISTVSSDYMFSTRIGSDGVSVLEWTAGAFEQITGYTFDEFVAHGGWLASLYPDDREKDEQDMETLRRNEPVDSEVRTIHKNGDIRWVRIYASPVWDPKEQRLAGINGAVQDVTARKRAEEDLLRTLEREQRLNEVARIISSAMDLGTVIATVVRLATELVGAEMGSLALITSGGEHLSEAYNYNVPPELFNPRPFPRGIGVGGTVLETDQPVSVDDYQVYPNAMQYGIDGGLHAFLGVPVIAGDKTLGVLKLFSRDPEKKFSSRDLALSAAIGQQAGIYIQNARLFEQTQRHAQQLSILNEVGRAVSTQRDLSSVIEVVFQQAQRSLDLDVFYIGLLTPEPDVVYFPFMYDSGTQWKEAPHHLSEYSHSKEVLASGQAQLVLRTIEELMSPAPPGSQVGNTRLRAATLMFAPLRAGEKVIGIVSVQSYAVNAYSQDDLILLTGIANQVAVAIENARLFDATQRQLEELTILHTISTLAVAAPGPAQLFDNAVLSIGQKVFSDRLTIWLLDEKMQELYKVADHHQSSTPSCPDWITPLNSGIIGTVAAQGKAMRVTDVSQAQQYFPGYPDSLSELCVPMRIGERVIGVINVESQEVDAFSESEERLLTTIAGLLATAMERLQSEAELEKRVRDRTADLEAANAELESFSYSISHDLRAPLRGIDGYSRLLQEEYASFLDTEGIHYLARVRQSAQRMGLLIDDLLKFSRLNRQPLHKQAINPTEMVHDLLQELKTEYAQRSVEFIVGDLPPCEVDPVLLRQVFMNLLTNALKYSSKQELARIEINCQQDGSQNIYFVRDNGVGFDMRYVDKLFRVFQRLHHTDEFEGTGVGLAIVQRIIQRHGGHVWAEGELHKGATFYFALNSENTSPAAV